MFFFLIPWSLDFHTVQFSGSSGYFFFTLNVVLLLIVRGRKVYLPMPPSWPEILEAFLNFFFFVEATGVLIEGLLFVMDLAERGVS